MLLEYTDKIERFSVDECFLDITQYLMGKKVIDIAKEISSRVLMELHFTVNIGIGDNKLLAKMASDFEKPNKIHTLYSYEIKSKMWPLEISELFMLGKKSVPKLNKLGIYTIGDIAKRPYEFMCNHFGLHGKQTWEYANGIDNSSVIYTRELPKSISHSTTLPRDSSDIDLLCKVLLDLTEKVGFRLRRHNLYATIISVQIRTKNFENYTKQVKLVSPTSVTKEIYEAAKKLFIASHKGLELRLIGVGVSGLVSDSDNVQLSIFELNNSIVNSVHKKYETIDNTLDKIKNKFGIDSVTLAGKIHKF